VKSTTTLLIILLTEITGAEFQTMVLVRTTDRMFWHLHGWDSLQNKISDLVDNADWTDIEENSTVQ